MALICLNESKILKNKKELLLNQFNKNISLWLVIVLMIVMIYNIFNQNNNAVKTSIGYSDFLAMVENQRVKDVVIQGQNLI